MIYISAQFRLPTNSNKDIFDKHEGKYVETLEHSNHKINLEFLANNNNGAFRSSVRMDRKNSCR